MGLFHILYTARDITATCNHAHLDTQSILSLSMGWLHLMSLAKLGVVSFPDPQQVRREEGLGNIVTRPPPPPPLSLGCVYHTEWLGTRQSWAMQSR